MCRLQPLGGEEQEAAHPELPSVSGEQVPAAKDIADGEAACLLAHNTGWGHERYMCWLAQLVVCSVANDIEAG